MSGTNFALANAALKNLGNYEDLTDAFNDAFGDDIDSFEDWVKDFKDLQGFEGIDDAQWTNSPLNDGVEWAGVNPLYDGGGDD